MAAPNVGDRVTVTLDGTVTKVDSNRGDQFLVELDRPVALAAPSRRQVWTVEDETAPVATEPPPEIMAQQPEPVT